MRLHLVIDTKKVSEAVKSCIIDEFQKENVETINRLGEVFPKAKEKCQDVAIHKTLHPDVTKSIVRRSFGRKSRGHRLQ